MADTGGQDLANFSMMELFRTEVESQAAVLSEGLLALEEHPDATEGIEALMRAAHSIKGAARIVGLDPAVRVAHAMEDCFVAAQEGRVRFRPEDVDVLLRGVDLLSRTSEVGESEWSGWLVEHGAEVEGMVADLGGVLSGKAVASVPAAAPPAPVKAAPEPVRTPEPPPSSSGGMDLANFSMMELFRTEVESQAAVLSEGLLALEEHPDATEGIEALMRAAHSIKGAARIVGLDPAVRVAHAMEDCFVAAQEGRVRFRPEDVDVLLRGVDLLSRTSEVGESEWVGWLVEHGAEVEGMVADLAGVLSGKAIASAPAAAPEPARTPEPPPSGGMDLANFSMMELFRTEVESQAAVLSEGLLVLEEHPDATEGIEALMRAAHSIKGAARIVGLDPAVRVAHAMEDCFVAAQEGKVRFRPEDVDVLLRGVDLLSRTSQVGESEWAGWLVEHGAEVEGMVSDLGGVLSGKVVASAPTAAPPAPVKAAPEPVRTPEPPPAAEPKPAVPPPAATRPAAASGDGRDRVVRVTAENLNRLMGLAGESLVEARWLRPFSDALLKLKRGQTEMGDLVGKLRETLEGVRLDEQAEDILNDLQQRAGGCRQILTERINDFEMFARRSANLSNRLYREVISSRMRPFSDGVQGFPRMIRDVSRKLGKKVRLEILGKSTDVDRDILEKLEAPLNHILRNAVDHGLEMPEDRVSAGKPEEGTVRLEARHRAGMLSITVSDDGRGIDPERIRQKVVDKKLATPEMAAAMSEPELMDFLFLPGFSTAKQVTEISGRGVGLDVVQSMVQEVSGTVRAVSRPGQGMTFQLQLPLTLSVIRTLLAEIAGEPYAFPLSRIDRSLKVPRSQVEAVEDRQFFSLDGSPVGMVTAHQVLELKETESSQEEVAVIVVSDRANRYGLVVDRFLGERDLVVRPLDGRLGKLPDISAASVMVDGSPVLIVDVEDMVRSIDNLLSGGRLRKIGRSAVDADARSRKRVLVVDDSLTVREVERKLLENQGYEVDVAVNGMDGWNAVRTGRYDLVVSDVDMPRMNGIEFVTLIKKDPTLKGIPVIIVSYKDRDEDRMRGLEAGANYYLTKSSFQDNTFLQAISDLVGEAAA